MYIAHKNKKNGASQTLKEHCENTANYCRDFSIPHLREILYVMGLLHDVGKYQRSFQERINGAPTRVEHSICGASLAYNMFAKTPLGLLLEYCIAGHHSGLPDGGSKFDDAQASTLNGRLKRVTEDFSAYAKELSVPSLKGMIEHFSAFLSHNLDLRDPAAADQLIDKFAFFTRYAFSCLVDADSIDTASFCGEDPFARPLKADFAACLKRLETRLEEFSCTTALQKARACLQKQAFANVKEDAEIYLLDMPTGSGKTLCSMKCALERALAKKKKRIIYVIPYNSIIDQTARDFSSLFAGCAEILRHQSTFSFEDSGADADLLYGEKKAVENWNAPIIITTAAQFFGTMISNKRHKLRKLHNTQDSVIIFDEAHLMPLDFLQPCLQAIGYITKYLNSEAIFLTATMPDFSSLMSEYVKENNNILPLITNKSDFAAFRKCRFEYLGETGIDGLLSKSMSYPSSLIIVNTKKLARDIYKASSMKKYHLSTYMTPLDRERVLGELRKELLKLEMDFPCLEGIPESRRILIVSTSLIEAGVDIDVYSVFRELNGLDNILQAAGRCNREGLRKDAVTYIFRSPGTKSNDVTNLTQGMLEKHEDIASLDCIREYYGRFLNLSRRKIIKNALHADNPSLASIGFMSYAESKNIIEGSTVSVVIPQCEEAEALVAQLKATGHANVRKLQRYACSVYPHELDELIRQHAVDDFNTGIYCLRNQNYYDRNLGLSIEPKDYII